MTMNENATKAMLLSYLSEAMDEGWAQIDHPDAATRGVARELYREAAEEYLAQLAIPPAPRVPSVPDLDWRNGSNPDHRVVECETVRPGR